MFLSFIKKIFHEARPQAGFTLLELIVVIAIFLVITGVVLTDIPNFRNRSSIELTAGEIATYLRGAQNYAVSRKITTYDGKSTFPDYQAVIDGQKFIIFASSTEGIDVTVPVESYEMVGFRLSPLGGNSLAELAELGSAVGIDFPGSQYNLANYSDLSPVFYVKNNGSLQPSSSDTLLSYQIIAIKITSVKEGISRCIFVFKNGQITLGACPESPTTPVVPPII